MTRQDFTRAEIPRMGNFLPVSKTSTPGPVGQALKRFVTPQGSLSMRALSEAAGLSEKAVQSIIDGLSKNPRGDTVGKLARALSISPQLLLSGEATPEMIEEALRPNISFHNEPISLEPRRVSLVDVPVYGRAQGGDDGFYDINLTDGPLEYVERPPALSGVVKVFAILVHGTSMEPVWQADDVVYVVPSRSISPGDYVLVTIERGPGHQPAALLKRFVSKCDDFVVLEQHNPSVRVEIERGKVREMWRALHWRDLR